MDKYKLKKTLGKTGLYLILIILSFFFLFPFFILITRSVMTDEEVASLPVKFFGSVIDITTYQRALDADLLIYLKNTIIVIMVNIIGIPISAFICAFGFARLDFKGRDVSFAIVLSTMMLPAIATQIPLYILFVDFGWIDTLLPLTIPGLFGGGAINIFLMRQYLKSIPKELDNAAKIDGANTWQTMWKIIFPLAKPIIFYTSVMSFLGVWNDFMGSLLYLKSPENYTLPIGIYLKFQSAIDLNSLPNIQMATGVLMMIPPLILFTLFQRQLIEGVVYSGLKG